MEVKIVDALPGAGKTSAAINYINSTLDDIRNFIHYTILR